MVRMKQGPESKTDDHHDDYDNFANKVKAGPKANVTETREPSNAHAWKSGPSINFPAATCFTPSGSIQKPIIIPLTTATIDHLISPPQSIPRTAAFCPATNTAQTHWMPREIHPPFPLSPADLERLTGEDLGRVIQSLHDGEAIAVADIPYTDFERWQATTARNMFCDNDGSESGSQQLARMRRAVQFIPRARRAGDHAGVGIGGVMIKCMPTPYHDAVFLCAAQDIKQAVQNHSTTSGGLAFEPSPGIYASFYRFACRFMNPIF